MTRRDLIALPALAPLAAQPQALAIDCHAHLNHHSRPSWREDDAKLIDAADKLGIGRLCCSILTPARPSGPGAFRQCNQWAFEAAQRFPGRILPYCYVNPGYTQAALDEIRRSVEDRGFIGVKLYNEYRADEPILDPVVELCIRLRVPILHHAGHTTWLSAPQPRISDGGHLAALARRYPDAMLICAHISGGGDWQWTIKALGNAPTVYLDLSGSVIDEGIIEMADRILGADRLLFGCDSSMTAAVGRLRSAEIPETAKRKIRHENMSLILARRARA
jgi:hypothetical protein